jgi:hypothetical protein
MAKLDNHPSLKLRMAMLDDHPSLKLRMAKQVKGDWQRLYDNNPQLINNHYGYFHQNHKKPDTQDR